MRLLLRSAGLSGRFCIEGNTVSEAQMDDLSYDEAGRLLRADFATGKLYWLHQAARAYDAAVERLWGAGPWYRNFPDVAVVS